MQSVAFGLTRATETEIALVIPPERRTVTYDWDRVPYRDSSVQVLRTCHYYTRVLRVAPLTAERWWCWDTGKRTLMRFTEGDEFEQFVSRHPDWIWLIANEPDREDQDALSPAQYAEFFGHVAAIVVRRLVSDPPDNVARLVFCQVSAARQRQYCERAYFTLKALVARRHWPDWPERVRPADVIHAISVHSYIATSDTCYAEGPRCYGSRLEEDELEDAAIRWTNAMNDFARWASNLDGKSLADKPLWLTEFGALWAFCAHRLEIRPRVDQVGGVGCPDSANRQNGRREDDFVFYGRNDREGLWGVQRVMLTYLLNPTGEVHANRGQWAAAWWFNTRIDWVNQNECAMTGWLFGHPVDCQRDLDTMSRAGETFRNTLQCLINSTRCPERLRPDRTP